MSLSAAACTEGPPAGLPPVDVTPGPGVLVRLTEAQLVRSLRALFGPELEVGGPVEPDTAVAGLRQVGASRTALSGWGVEQYEALAASIANRALQNGARSWMPCRLESVDIETCRDSIFRYLGERAWRRPLSDAELESLRNIYRAAAEAIPEEGAKAGLRYVISAVLQAPDFIYRVETGAADGQLDSFELATRLAFFLWNAPPDSTLWAAARAGTISETLTEAAERMMADPRFEDGTRAFFEDAYHLYELDQVTKDPAAFVHFSSDLGAEAREETLRGLIALLVREDGDFREVFRAERTFVSRRLAALYRVRATSLDGFGEVQLERSNGRRGLLGQASFLMLNAHPLASSATLRGKFVREVFLCDTIPAPPADVNTALPEPTREARTLRERVQQHLEDPSCAGCHNFMDPVGLGLEQFDAVGAFRSHDRGVRIDPSGDLDGAPFSDAWTLADVIAEHPKVPFCLVRSVFRYALSRPETPGETSLLTLIAERFSTRGFTWRELVLDVVQSPSFRLVTKEAS